MEKRTEMIIGAIVAALIITGYIVWELMQFACKLSVIVVAVLIVAIPVIYALRYLNVI